jgi:glutathione S-transferase
MAITLSHAPMSSASPVVWALAELGIKHESIKLDLKGTKHKEPQFLALNPMGQVPTLVDDEQPMFESSAIIIHLGEKYGVERNLWPRVTSPEHMVALTWTAWFGITFGGTLRQIFGSSDKLGAPAEFHNAAMYRHGIERLSTLMSIFDTEMGKREYVSSDKFILADCYVAGSLGWATQVIGFDLAKTPNIAAYVKRCMSRPATAAMGL